MPLRGGNLRGFPFDEEDAAGAWSNLASRHPEIAARIRNRPQNWARKRRPQDGTEQDFGEGFFEEIPPEFREHFPNHWNRQGSQSQPPTSPQQNQPPQQQVPKHVTIATQTDPPPDAIDPSIAIPCHDVPKPAPPQPIFVDAEERNQSSTPAPPEQPNMSSQQAPQQEQPANDQHSNVRHIPIFVEGRDEPVINKNAHFTESKPSFQHPPQSEREQYFQDEPDGFHHPPNFSRPFNSPFSKGFRQTPQPFAQHMYPQAAFARSNSPRRSQSPKAHPAHEEPFVKVPVHHEQTAQPEQNQPRPQSRQQQQQPQQQQPQQQQSQQPQQQQRQQSPQPKPQPPPSNDPITQILSIQTDVLNLMGDVEKFNGTKKDKQYMYLDEMLTRNLIKLDTIETEGKENIRLARKEAIKCIQKCIAVLEAKAEKGPEAQPDVEMNSAPEQTENGEIDMKETKDEQIAQVANTEASSEPAAADTRPQDKPEIVEPPKEEKKTKKKIFKKRDKSKEQKGEVKDAMQVDANVENSPSMEVDGTVPSQ